MPHWFRRWLLGRRPGHGDQIERLRAVEREERRRLQQVVSASAQATVEAEKSRQQAHAVAQKLKGKPDEGRHILLTAENVLRLIEEEHKP